MDLVSLPAYGGEELWAEVMSTLQRDEEGIQGAEQEQAGHSRQVGEHLLLAA